MKEKKRILNKYMKSVAIKEINKMWVFVRTGILCCFLFISIPGFSKVRLAKVFSNHMVIQRDQSVDLNGWADAGEKVTVVFNKKVYRATATVDSVWSISLPAHDAGGPFEIEVKGSTNSLVITDIYFGDVWFCSGQSNMDFRVKSAANAELEIADANYPLIRQLEVRKIGTPAIESDISEKSNWWVCSPKSAGNFSAVAYFFAREIYKTNKVPIGIIHSSWGGSPIEAFMPATAFAGFPNQQKQIAAITGPQFVSDLKQKVHGYPTLIYNGMIAPLTTFPVKGFLWYQGEANRKAPACWNYEKMLSNLITSWRSAWGLGKLPFLIVQLPTYGIAAELPVVSTWNIVQEAQYNVSKNIPGAAMAVTNDLGNPTNIHPIYKQEVGRRLSLIARTNVYNEKGLISQGPVFRSLKKEKNKVILSFDHMGSGLVVKNGGEQLNGFTIAGADHHFYRAEAKISGDKVVVWCNQVPTPIDVRYAFESSPPQINFYNKEGLPAMPFRTDSLKEITSGPN